ncbi:hypothetical protein C8R44DRAFT_976713 [Mycena epipterygia]|nr:hypothetical protein C8R44DRAFT_976713 [Mycena epipterygia]
MLEEIVQIDATLAAVAISLIALFVPPFLNLLALSHQDDLSWDDYVFLCPMVTATFTPVFALITARLNILYTPIEPLALYLTFVTGILLTPSLAGFACGAAVVLLLKLVPVLWNTVLRSNGMHARVIRTEPTSNDIRILLSPVVALLLAYLEPLAFLSEEGEFQLQPLINPPTDNLARA